VATTTDSQHSLDFGGLNPMFLDAQPHTGNQWRAGKKKGGREKEKRKSPPIGKQQSEKQFKEREETPT